MGAAEGLLKAIGAAIGVPVLAANIAGIGNTEENIARVADTGGTSPGSTVTSTEETIIPGAAPGVPPKGGTTVMDGTDTRGRKGRKAAYPIAPGPPGWR
jgi:hypothetical protein